MARRQGNAADVGVSETRLSTGDAQNATVPPEHFERLCVVENAQTNTAGPSSTTVMTVSHWAPA